MTPETHILVLYTGGTLGMVQSEQGLVPAGDFDARLRAALEDLPPSRRGRLPAFTLREFPQLIDSSSATPADWQQIAGEIADAYDSFDGFVVLQGTDTLAWTASSLAFQLKGTARPVIVSGAQLPLEADGSDALANVELALTAAAQPTLNEVVVAFGGQLLRGVCTRKWYTQDHRGFTTPNAPLLGEWVDDRVVVYPGRLMDDQGPAFELPDYACLGQDAVIRLPLYPGISAESVRVQLLRSEVKGAVLELWGSGNLPADAELLGVLADARGEGKLLAGISQCPHGPVSIGHYAAGAGLATIGILSGDDMTLEAAFTKLLHLVALNQDEDWQRERFLMPWVGERASGLL
ncbi:asparaginase [Cobetia marina]|nr:asparaginase [Cobetia marina]TKD64507.1 asparaginase [Cobetia marina]GED42186.1 L-asparaginase 1 [Cobetia marina]